MKNLQIAIEDSSQFMQRSSLENAEEQFEHCPTQTQSKTNSIGSNQSEDQLSEKDSLVEEEQQKLNENNPNSWNQRSMQRQIEQQLTYEQQSPSSIYGPSFEEMLATANANRVKRSSQSTANKEILANLERAVPSSTDTNVDWIIEKVMARKKQKQLDFLVSSRYSDRKQSGFHGKDHNADFQLLQGDRVRREISRDDQFANPLNSHQQINVLTVNLKLIQQNRELEKKVQQYQQKLRRLEKKRIAQATTALRQKNSSAKESIAHLQVKLQKALRLNEKLNESIITHRSKLSQNHLSSSSLVSSAKRNNRSNQVPSVNGQNTEFVRTNFETFRTVNTIEENKKVKNGHNHSPQHYPRKLMCKNAVKNKYSSPILQFNSYLMDSHSRENASPFTNSHIRIETEGKQTKRKTMLKNKMEQSCQNDMDYEDDLKELQKLEQSEAYLLELIDKNQAKILAIEKAKFQEALK